MKIQHLIPILFLLGLIACSQQKPQASNSMPRKMRAPHEYFVTFAVVKIPDEVLKQHGGFTFTNSCDFSTLEARYKFAAYILAHTNEFSFTTITGNAIPLVWNNQSTSMRILLDPKQEELDFEKYGIKTTTFDVGIDVQEEDDSGDVGCTWSCSYMVHLKEPIGNSTDHGGGGPVGGERLTVGQPDITPLFRGKGVTLWQLVELKRG